MQKLDFATIVKLDQIVRKEAVSGGGVSHVWCIELFGLITFRLVECLFVWLRVSRHVDLR